MYETLSNNFIGHIDSIKKEGAYYSIRGWVVPLLESADCMISNEGFISIAPEERKDIYNHFKQIHLNYLRSGFNVVLNPSSEETIIKVNGEDVFKIKLDLMESILLPNPRSWLDISVTNNFYNNPHAVREYALKQNYSITPNYQTKNRSVKSFTPSWIKNAFQLSLGKAIKEFVGPSGVFQYTTAKDQIEYHIEQHKYTALICLSIDAPTNTGISTFRSRKTELFGCATKGDAHAKNLTIEELNSLTLNNNNYYDCSNFEKVDIIANVFNRLIIYNSKNIHASSLNYGNTKENGKLFHTFFFNC